MRKPFFVGLNVVLMVFFITVSLQPASAVVIGPGDLPIWHEEAQVQLGWVFDDPTTPENTEPLSGWSTAIGEIPVWSYNETRVDPFVSNPAQWYIQVPNLHNENELKHFWLVWVYDFDPLADPRTFTSIDWSPDGGYTNLGIIDEWFDASGTLTEDINEAVYGRMTIIHDLYPNPEYEEIWLGLTDGYYVREVYLKTYCTPLPGSVLLLGTGLMGLGLLGYRRKRN